MGNQSLTCKKCDKPVDYGTINCPDCGCDDPGNTGHGNK